MRRWIVGLLFVMALCSLACLSSDEDEPRIQEPPPEKYQTEADFPLVITDVQTERDGEELTIDITYENYADYEVDAFRQTMWFYDSFGDPVPELGFGDPYQSYQYQETFSSGDRQTVRTSEFGYESTREVVLMQKSYLVDGEERFCGDLDEGWHPEDGLDESCAITFEVE